MVADAPATSPLLYVIDRYRCLRSASLLHVHVVFVTKHRRGVLSPRCFPVLRDAFTTVPTDFGATVRETDGADDHVHLLVEYLPAVSVVRLVRSLMGVRHDVCEPSGFPS